MAAQLLKILRAHARTHTHQWSYPHCVLRAPLHDGDPGRRTMWKQVRITTQHIMSLPCIQDAGRLEKEVTNCSTFNDSGILPCQRWELLLHSHNSPLEKTLWLPPLQKGTLRHYEVSVSPRKSNRYLRCRSHCQVWRNQSKPQRSCSLAGWLAGSPPCHSRCWLCQSSSSTDKTRKPCTDLTQVPAVHH